MSDTLIDTLKAAEDALSRCYNVTEWPADGTTPQDEALAKVRAALAAPVAQKEPCARVYIHPQSLMMRQVPTYDVQSFEVESPHWAHHGDLFFRAAPQGASHD